MIRRMLGWFRVRRNDPILISVCLLVLLSLALPMVIVLDLTWNAWSWTIYDNGTLIGFAALSGSLLGLSAIFANPVSYRRFDRLFSLIGAVAMAASLFWVGNIYRIWDGGQLKMLSRREQEIYWIGWRGLAFLLGVFLASAALIGLVDLIARPLFGRVGQSKVTRTRFLVVSAVVLFVAAMLKNILGSFFSDAFEQRGSLIWIVLVSWFLGGVLLPGIVASRIGSFGFRCMATILLCGSSAGILIAYLATQAYDPTMPCIAVVVFSLLMAIPMIIVKPKSQTEPAHSQARGDKDSGPGWSLLWSGLAIATVLSAIFLIYRYDPLTLYTVKTADRWKLARKMRTFNSDAATDFYGVAIGVQGTSYADFQIRFSEDSKTDYMNRFEGFPLMSSYSLFGIHPGIELASLSKAAPMQLQIFDSRVNKDQLNQLFNTTSQLRMANVEFDGASGELSPSVGAWWRIERFKPGETAKVLDSIKSFKGVGNLTIYDTDCNLEDWKQLVRASQECPVRLHASVPDDLFEQWEPSQEESLENLSIQYLKGQARLAMRLAFDTDANVSNWSWQGESDWPEFFDSDHYWAMALVFGHLTEVEARYDSLRIRRNEGAKAIAEDLHQAAESNFWAMSKTGDETIESFYFPGLPKKLLKDLQHFPELKRLSLDWRWVNVQLAAFGSVERVDFSSLASLTKLESLHLAANLEPEDLSFLGKLQSLTELQISPNRTFFNKPGFEQCTSLRKLTLLNSPNGKVLKEIRTLKSLEELTIVDIGYTLTESKTQAALRAKFPNLKVTIIGVNDYEPVPTKEFEQHLKRVKAETRELFIND